MRYSDEERRIPSPPHPDVDADCDGESHHVGNETMWGRLTLVAKPGNEQRVVMKVYTTTLEHFAIVYPDKTVAKPFGCINLKHSRVEPLVNCDRSFRVVQKSCDGAALEFRVESALKRDAWLTALHSQTQTPMGKGKSSLHSQHSSYSLPVVEEDEEE